MGFLLFVVANCLYLLKYACFKHDFHIRWCLCLLMVTCRVLEHMTSLIRISQICVAYCLVIVVIIFSFRRLTPSDYLFKSHKLPEMFADTRLSANFSGNLWDLKRICIRWYLSHTSPLDKKDILLCLFGNRRCLFHTFLKISFSANHFWCLLKHRLFVLSLLIINANS